MSALDPLARLIVRILSRVLPPSTADDVVGDLVEQYRRRRRFPRLWLVGQAVDLAWGLSGSLNDPRPPASVRLDVWVNDVRYAFRSLFRSRGFAAVALISLALGIGLTTAVFSVIDGVLLRPLPYDDPEHIVRIRQLVAGRALNSDAVTRALLQRMELNARTLSAIAPYSVLDARLRTESASFVGVKVSVSEQFFDVLRTSPGQGRLLGRADGRPGAPLVAVLSHAFWASAYGSDPSVVGRSIQIDDQPVEIAGVLPATFTYPTAEAAIYVPGRWRLPEGIQAFVGPSIDVIARMRQGVDVDDVARETGALWRELRNDAAPRDRTSFDVVRLQDDLARDLRPALIVLLASVACVLAIVCVNLTNLLLARGTARQREMAVRAALGASRWRMARPLALEGILLSLLGGAAGAGLAWALVASMPLTASIDPMLAAQVRVDGRVVAFALIVSGLIGVVIGVLPAWQAPADRVTATISSGQVRLLPGTTISAERVRGGLVVVQVALAIVLAVAATLLSRSLVRLVTVDLGFRPEQALTFQVHLPSRGGVTYDWRARFYEELLDRLAAHPSVRAAGFTSSLPTHETFSLAAIRIDGVLPPDPADPFQAHREVVTADYFTALGMTMITGRALLPTDTTTSERVLVVNDAFVRRFLAGREPLRQRVMLFGDWHRIVGVVKSKRHAGLRSDVRPELYAALAQSPPDTVSQSGAGVVLRTTGAPLHLLPFVRSTLRELQPEAAVENEAALADRIWATTAQPRFYASVMGAFAALALVTAMVGLFGVLTYIVERRRREIGVRRALGATERNIFDLFLRHGLKLVGVAIPLGIVGATAGVGLLRNLLFGIQPMDPVAFTVVVIVVPLVAIASCVWPARRAASIEPLDALREE